MSTAEALVETAAPQLHVVDADTSASVAQREANRWIVGFGGPCLVGAVFVAAAIGSGHAWLLGIALLCLLTAICSLAWLSISSDTNA